LLADYLAGEDVRDQIKDAVQFSPDMFERTTGSALLRLRGSSRRRLCELPEVAVIRLRWMDRATKGNDEQRRRAVEQLGLLRDPTAVPALEKAVEDSVAVVAAAAIRGLLLMPSYDKREELLRSLPNRSYLIRVLTACESADDALRLAIGPPADDRMLELARLHGRVTGEGDLLPLMDGRDAKKRNSALRLVPLAAPGAAPSRGVVLAALRHHQLKMRSAAVEVAAKLRLSRAIPGIAEYARQADTNTDARASCAALAELGSAGRDLLRQMSAAGEAGDAPAEALGAMMAASVRGGGA
jgi:HEAT repeats